MGWPASLDAVSAWWKTFVENTSRADLSQQFNRAAFASGLLWNIDDATAYDKLKVLIEACKNDSQMYEFITLSGHAHRKAKERRDRMGSKPAGRLCFEGEACVEGEVSHVQHVPEGEASGTEDVDMPAKKAEAPAVSDPSQQAVGAVSLNEAVPAPEETFQGDSKSSSLPGPVEGHEECKRPALDDEQRAIIAENKRKALERRRLLREGNCSEEIMNKGRTGGEAIASVIEGSNLPSGEVARPVATPMSVEPPLMQQCLASEMPVATPMSVEPPLMQQCLTSEMPQMAMTGVAPAPSMCISRLDTVDTTGPVEGTVRHRCDHKTGGGFQVRICDATGEIDVKFWREAADFFREHDGLRQGALVRLRGFRRIKLKDKVQLGFAPAGRSYDLSFDSSQGAQIEVLCAPAPQAADNGEELDLTEALLRPAGRRVNIKAWAVAVDDDSTAKRTRNDDAVIFRVVWLATSLNNFAPRTRWVIWNDIAQHYGPNQLLRKHVRIRGAQIKEWNGSKQLKGCWQTGGIEVLPR